MKVWYLGSMNDGLFIIDKPPSPSGTDIGPMETGKGPDMILNVTALSQVHAQAIVNAHNEEVRLTASPPIGVTDNIPPDDYDPRKIT